MKTFSLSSYMDDLTRICAIDSGHAFAEGTRAMAAFFEERFASLGMLTQVRYYGDNDFAPFLVASSRPVEEMDTIDFLLVAHMDTVFPVGTAAERPLTVDENNIGHGPGCVDCKGGALMVWYLMKELLSEGPLPGNFVIAFNSDEEKGSRYSRPYFEEFAKKTRCCLVFEPGRANDEFVSARKGGANYIVRCHGIAAHSGVEPEKGASAILELARWVPELYQLTDYAKGTTINIGRFTGGADNGSVPDYAEFTVSFRYLDISAFDALKEKLAYIQAHPFDPRTRIEVEQVSLRPAMARHESTEALLQVLEETAAALGQKAEHITTGGGSDGNFISPFGVATLDGCGPCGAALHTRDEYLKVWTVEPRLELMTALIQRLSASSRR